MLSVFAVRNSERESISDSKMLTVWLSGPNDRMPLRIAESDAAGMAVRNACTPRWKSRLSKTFVTVASSGKPSVNLSVPSRVSMLSGVVMAGGMSVAYLGLSAGCLSVFLSSLANRGARCPLAASQPSTAPAARTAALVRIVRVRMTPPPRTGEYAEQGENLPSVRPRRSDSAGTSTRKRPDTRTCDGRRGPPRRSCCGSRQPALLPDVNDASGHLLQVLHLRGNDLPVERERRLVEVVQRHRRAEVAADVETVVRGEGEWGADRRLPLGYQLPIHLEHHIQRGTGCGRGQLRFDLDLHLADGQLVLRLDLRALDLEQVVLVAESAVLDVAGQSPGERPERVEDAIRLLGHLDFHADDVVELPQLRRCELGHPGDGPIEGPLRVGRGG